MTPTRGRHAIHLFVDETHFSVTIRAFLRYVGKRKFAVRYDLSPVLSTLFEREAKTLGLNITSQVLPMQFQAQDSDLCQQMLTSLDEAQGLGFPQLAVVRSCSAIASDPLAWNDAESCWNELSEAYPLTILCTYHAYHRDPEYLQEILAQHPYYFSGGSFLPNDGSSRL